MKQYKYSKGDNIMPTIKELRQKSGLSQSKFAAKYHIGLTTLQHWEQGVTKTPEVVLYLLNEVMKYEEQEQ